jgi:hypothetical protein
MTATLDVPSLGSGTHGMVNVLHFNNAGAACRPADEGAHQADRDHPGAREGQSASLGRLRAKRSRTKSTGPHWRPFRAPPIGAPFGQRTPLAANRSPAHHAHGPPSDAPGCLRPRHRQSHGRLAPGRPRFWPPRRWRATTWRPGRWRRIAAGEIFQRVADRREDGAQCVDFALHSGSPTQSITRSS